MADPALKLECFVMPNQQFSALVENIEDGLAYIIHEGQTLAAHRAASCALRPEPGDEAAVFRAEDGRLFITAVLTRASAEAPVFDLPQGAAVASGGRLDFIGREEISFTTPRLAVTAEEAELKAGRLNFLGEAVRAVAETWSLFGKTMFTTLERLNQRLGASSRIVAGHDETQAETVRQAARKNHVTQAENVVVTAAETVRVDGEQINLA